MCPCCVQVCYTIGLVLLQQSFDSGFCAQRRLVTIFVKCIACHRQILLLLTQHVVEGAYFGKCTLIRPISCLVQCCVWSCKPHSQSRGKGDLVTSCATRSRCPIRWICGVRHCIVVVLMLHSASVWFTVTCYTIVIDMRGHWTFFPFRLCVGGGQTCKNKTGRCGCASFFHVSLPPLGNLD